VVEQGLEQEVVADIVVVVLYHGFFSSVLSGREVVRNAKYSHIAYKRVVWRRYV